MFQNFTDKFIDIQIKFLNSRIGFWLAYVIPLIVILAPQSVRTIENIISSNWLQLWALFAISVSQARIHKHLKEHS